MAEIVNLKREKKRRARADAAQEAAENRIRFGRSMTARLLDEATAARTARGLDGARLVEPPEPKQ